MPLRTDDDLGPVLEEKLMGCLLHVDGFADRYLAVAKGELFVDPVRRYVVNLMSDHVSEHHEVPSPDVLLLEAGRQGYDDVGAVRQVLDVPANALDAAYVAKRVEAWSRWRAVDLVLAESQRFDDPAEMLVEMQTALRSTELDDDEFTDLGVDRKDESVVGQVIPTPWSWINDRTPAGGPEVGDFAVVMTVINGGKTTVLVNVTRHVIALGGQVVYFTFEDGESKIKRRLMQSITGLTTDEILGDVPRARSLRDRFLERTGGGCVVKGLKSRRSTVQDVIGFVDYLRKGKGRRVDMVVTDYADRFRARTRRDDMRHELREVYEDCKYAAQEMGVVHWSASQIAKTRTDEGVVGIEHGSESTGKFESCDMALGFGQSREDRVVGQMTLHASKMRDGPRGQTTSLLADFDRQRVYERGDPALDKRRL